MSRITFNVCEFTPRRIAELPLQTIIRDERRGCLCLPSLLPTVLEVNSDFALLFDITVESLDVPSCSDVIYSGADDDETVEGIINFDIDRNSSGWALTLTDSETSALLFKVANVDPDVPATCLISSPSGYYEGDGYTAQVNIIS